MHTRWLLLVAITLITLGTSWVLLDHKSQQAVTEHPVTIPEALRTVTVSATMPSPSVDPHHLSAMLEEGVMPKARRMAEVMTDTDCAPDAHMISHCRNEMLLADGRTLILRHPHDMSRVPCLAPGEKVLLVPAAA